MPHDFRRTAIGYLGFLAVACVICSMVLGPCAMLFVWVATAVGLYLLDDLLGE